MLILLGACWLANYLIIPTDWKIKVWQCPFKSIMGFACPGCGTTRGFYAIIIHHDIHEAIVRYNALSVIEIPMLILLSIMLALDFLMHKHMLYDICIKIDIALKQKRILIPIILLIIANWGWNILKDI